MTQLEKISLRSFLDGIGRENYDRPLLIGFETCLDDAHDVYHAMGGRDYLRKGGSTSDATSYRPGHSSRKEMPCNRHWMSTASSTSGAVRGFRGQAWCPGSTATGI